MSIRTMARVWELSQHSGTNLLVLLANRGHIAKPGDVDSANIAARIIDVLVKESGLNSYAYAAMKKAG